VERVLLTDESSFSSIAANINAHTTRDLSKDVSPSTYGQELSGSTLLALSSDYTTDERCSEKAGDY
jgi:hypothetical protein